MTTYDQWKTTDPREYEDEYEYEDCCHEEYEADILTGIATCDRCGHRWMQTREEIAREHERQREYDQWQRRENRREFWRKLTYPIRWPIYQLLSKLWPRKSCSVLTDDEIPF